MKITRSLTQLALEIGTLIAVIKMVVESILESGGEENLPKAIILNFICKNNMVKLILKLIAAVVWLVIVVFGLFLLFT